MHGPPAVSGSTASASAIVRVTIRNSLESAPLETVASSVLKSCLKPLLCVPELTNEVTLANFDRKNALVALVMAMRNSRFNNSSAPGIAHLQQFSRDGAVCRDLLWF